MPKRKRSEAENVIDKIEDRAVRIKASRLHAKIEHGNQSLKAALGLARGFERQKLSRRQKQASQEPHTLLRLREEVIVLKEFDIAETAHNHLFKQLARTKRIRESPAFVALFGDNPKTKTPKNNAEANVLGRLFKANPVKEVLPGILGGIRGVLKLDEEMPPNNSTQHTNGTGAEKSVMNATNSQGSDGEDDFDGFSDNSRIAVLNDSTESNNVELKTDSRMYKERLGSSSVTDEDNIVDELDPMEDSDEDGLGQDRQSSISISISDVSEDQNFSKRHRDTTKSKQKPSASFLPSLGMGGYYSGSESDGEDANNKLHSNGPPLPRDRRNRRGQRERQKIAELKFGKNAKHLQSQKTRDKDSRNAGWDAKRGAVDGTGYDPTQKRFGRGSFAKSTGPTGTNGEMMLRNRTATTNKPAAKKDAPLHPSWEAAKKKKQESGQAAFAGTKITFD